MNTNLRIVYRGKFRENGLAICFYAYKQSEKYATPIWPPFATIKAYCDAHKIV